MVLPLQALGHHEFQTFPLLVEKLYTVLPKQHALAKRRAVSLEELQDDPETRKNQGLSPRASDLPRWRRRVSKRSIRLK